MYICIYNPRKNQRGRNIQLKCSRPTAIDCIINLGFKIHQNSRTEPKYLYIYIYIYIYKEKNQFFGTIIHLFLWRPPSDAE